MVLAGAQPLLRRSVPDDRSTRCTARCRCARSRRRCSISRPRAGSTGARWSTLTNCTFDGHVYNIAPRDGRVPGDQAGPDLPVGRGVVRLRALLAVPIGRAPAMGAARGAEGGASQTRPYLRALPGAGRSARRGPRSQGSRAARHAPDARSAQGRASASTRPTRRTSRCRRCARARWCWSRDEDYHHVERPFKEAVFTHASTSPNLQIIASLDVARRQMELEGYELVDAGHPARARDPPRGQHASADLEVLPRAATPTT